MSDLIDRQAAIDALNKLARDGFTLQDHFQAYLDALKDVDMKIRKLPAVDAVPVVHGRWEEHTDVWGETSYYACTACGEEWVTIDGTPEENGMKFCPKCGAVMDGKDDTND